MFEDGREIQELADVKRPSPSLRPVFGLSGNTLQIHQNHIEYVRKKRPNRHWAWNHWLKYKLYSIYLSTSIKMFVCVYIYIYTCIFIPCHLRWFETTRPPSSSTPSGNAMVHQWGSAAANAGHEATTSHLPLGEAMRKLQTQGWMEEVRNETFMTTPEGDTEKKKQQQEPSWHVNFNKFCMIFCTPGGVSGPWISFFYLQNWGAPP